MAETMDVEAVLTHRLDLVLRRRRTKGELMHDAVRLVTNVVDLVHDQAAMLAVNDVTWHAAPEENATELKTKLELEVPTLKS